MAAHPIRNTFLALLVLILVAVAALLSYSLGRVDDPSLRPAFDVAAAPPPPSLERVPSVATRRALFGDLHVHTSYSVDAFVFGVRALPDDAYRFAKGGTIEHGAGYPIRLRRPLDFLAVTDHAEYLGTARAAELDIPTTRRPLADVLRNGSRLEMTRYWIDSVTALTSHGFAAGEGGRVFGDPSQQDEVERDAWREIVTAAERHDAPGVFTAFIGYEWSSWGIHRNVVYGSCAPPRVRSARTTRGAHRISGRRSKRNAPPVNR
jgi:hypothetical protein